MQQDWVEFNGKAIRKILIRPELISWVSDDKADQDDQYVAIHIDDGSRDGCELGVNEPYEQVKQKIMDAEKADYSDVVVEHFTREEYEYLLQSLKDAHVDIMFPPQNEDEIALYERIKNKLKGILKEEE